MLYLDDPKKAWDDWLKRKPVVAAVVELGDVEGHVFHGNQWTGGFLSGMKSDTLANDMAEDRDSFQAGSEGGGVSVSTWYVTPEGEHYLVKEGGPGETMTELMSKHILDKTDLMHMDVRRGAPLEEDGSGVVVIQHMNDSPLVKDRSFELGSTRQPEETDPPEVWEQRMRDEVGLELFDRLISNPDRHGANIGTVIDQNGDSRLAVIDNSLAMGSSFSSAAREADTDWATPEGRAQQEGRFGFPAKMLAMDLTDSLGEERTREIVADAFDRHLASFERGIDSLETPAVKRDIGVTSEMHPAASLYADQVGRLRTQADWVASERDAYINSVVGGADVDKLAQAYEDLMDGMLDKAPNPGNPEDILRHVPADARKYVEEGIRQAREGK